eukprot:CCRYP_010437-RA/>CCRYP_010437-RA protein AED:0.27 eAED:0.28 QI:0/0/0/1/0/0/2/0/223
MQDALGLTSDQVYRWRLLLEEYGPTVMYIKGIHNTVADAISRLDYGPITNDRSTWMTFPQCWCYHNTAQTTSSPATTEESMNQVFANQNEEDSIYPLTTREIAEAQQEDESLLNKGYSTHLVENIKALCKDGKMIIPKSLQHHAVATPGPSSQRNSSSFDVLERSKNDSPITCQKVSQLPGEQAQNIKIRETAYKTCNHQPMQGIMSGPHRTVHPQGQGQDTN